MELDSKKLFTRKATGIVREVSPTGAMMFNINSVNPNYALLTCLLVESVGTAWVFGSLAIAALVAVVFVSVYVCFTATMPRSGGDCVFTSRTMTAAFGSTWGPIIGPMLAFVGSLSMWGAEIIFQSVNSIWVASTYIASALISLGLPDLAMAMMEPMNTLIVSWVVLILVNATMLWGMKTLIKLQWFAFVFGMLGTFIGGAYLWQVFLSPGGHQAFVDSFNVFAGPYLSSPNPYEEVSSYLPSMSFTALETFIASVLIFTSVGYPFFSTYIAGEIKEANSLRKQAYSMFTPIVVVTALVLFIMIPLEGLAGQAFLGGAENMFYIPPFPWSLPAPPSPFLWIGLTVSDRLANIIVQIAGVMWGFLICAILPPMLTRTPFQWSFDRFLPEVFSRVDEKHHSPYVTVLFVTALSMIAAAFLAFQQQLIFLAGLAVTGASAIMFATTFSFVSLAAVVFPYKMRGIYEKSAISKHKLLGLPLMSVVGALSFVSMVSYTYFSFTAPELGVIAVPETVQIVLGIIAASFIAYFGILASRKLLKHDIDYSGIFTAIPPE